MEKKQIINRFTKSIIVEEQRKNRVTTQQITSTLITAALNLAFVNESCKSTGRVSKSQVIYRKLEGKSMEELKECFRENTIRFLKILKILSRNRKFIISLDTTKEAFYGDFSKAEDKIYLHAGSIERESYYYYEYLTAAITCNVTSKYILDGIIVPRGYYVEDYVYEMTKFLIEYLPVEVALFDRGFGSWGVVYKLKKLNVNFLIFWKKQGDWYKKHLNHMKNGEVKKIIRKKKYNRDKSNFNVNCAFALVKQLEYEGKIYDWIFATNLDLKSAEAYVKRYKKRWAIETIYRVTDKIRTYTTSTNSVIRYFLFMFTCLVYNIWRFFQMFLGEGFTLSNFKVNMIIFMAKYGMVYPKHYDSFEEAAMKLF
jgi:putative transposase